MAARGPKPLVVALGAEAQALRLVQAAFWAARESGRPWIAVHVRVEGEESEEERGQAMLWLQEAEGLGARTLWRSAHTVSGGLQEVMAREGADLLILGRTAEGWPWSRLGHSLAAEMIRRLPGSEVRVVGLDRGLPPERLLPEPDRRLGAAIATGALVLAATGLGWILPEGASLPAIFLLYLLASALAAHHWGRLAGLTAVGASAVLFDLVFDSNPWSLIVGNLPLMLLFTAVLMGGQVAVGLSDRLAREVRMARRREALMAVLLLLGRRLALATRPEEVATALASVTERVLRRPVRLLVPRENTWITLPSGEAEVLPEGLAEGLTSPPIAGPPPLLQIGGAAWLSLGHQEGFLSMELGDTPVPEGESLDLLHAAAAQTTLAMERLRWLETAQKARVAHEAERLRSSLLGAISHDLRTPLAAIHGAAASMLLAEDLPEPTRRDLLSMVRDESDRLAHLLSNILDLTRLETAGIALAREWHPLDEIVASALARAEAQAGPMDLKVDLGPEPPLVCADGPLLEQLLLNLLANARRHAPGSPITLEAHSLPEAVELTVSDRGPGIPAAHRDRIFEKFVRLPGRGDGGAGLGLAICEAIARAHGGRIWVDDAPGGGAAFHVRLPLDLPRPTLPEEPT